MLCGMEQVGILRMFEQYALFEQYQQRLSALVGAAQAQRIVNGALFLMTLGGNDFVNNYFLTPVSARSRQFTVPQYPLLIFICYFTTYTSYFYVFELHFSYIFFIIFFTYWFESLFIFIFSPTKSVVFFLYLPHILYCTTK